MCRWLASLLSAAATLACSAPTSLSTRSTLQQGTPPSHRTSTGQCRPQHSSRHVAMHPGAVTLGSSQQTVQLNQHGFCQSCSAPPENDPLIAFLVCSFGMLILVSICSPVFVSHPSLDTEDAANLPSLQERVSGVVCVWSFYA